MAFNNNSKGNIGIAKREVWMIIVFAIILLFSIVFGYPYLSNLKNPTLSYLLFLLIWAGFSWSIGELFHKGIKVAVAGLIFFVLLDVLMPPLILSMDAVPTQEMDKFWGSELFLYNIYALTGLPHFVIYCLVYLVSPVIGLIIIAYLLPTHTTREQIKGIIR